MMEKLLAKTKTIGELIEELSRLDPAMKVLAEGCDCINPITQVGVFHTNGTPWASIEVDTSVTD